MPLPNLEKLTVPTGSFIFVLKQKKRFCFFFLSLVDSGMETWPRDYHFRGILLSLFRANYRDLPARLFFFWMDFCNGSVF